jgi:geranylgeranyl diphosphate synthase type II
MQLAKLFSKTALKYEGQQWDVDQARDDADCSRISKMIEYKTAVLVAAAMKMVR